MSCKNESLREMLAEARAIYYAMTHGAITYQQAKLQTMPILDRINTSITLIAKKYKVKPKYITFYHLGRNF